MNDGADYGSSKIRSSLAAPSYFLVLAALLAAALLAACTAANSSPAATDASASGSSAAPVSSGQGTPVPAGPAAQFNGERAMKYTREVVAFGPRPAGSPAHGKLESYLLTQLAGLATEADAFTAATPLGPRPMRNFIVRLPGSRPGVIVVCGHYDTKLLPGFVGANDGGSSTGLLLELARELKLQMKDGRLDGYSVWLVFLDGEEAFGEWTATDSLYGSRHLAARWQADGTLKNLKALLLVDMIGDADLDILRDLNSTAWLAQLVFDAAQRLGYQSHFYAGRTAVEDDHMPFAQRGVPVVDLIDFNYGYNNAYWHTKNDTLDKLSPRSFTIVGSVVLESLRLLNQR
jgi:hypothetical protein